mmetsp:Transcript_5645/g.14537  ORF Transcript_5645/g.14537 Transcript_5645/m.14537 type:complete len:205 (+) Transcript_5645:661-1275(+)
MTADATLAGKGRAHAAVVTEHRDGVRVVEVGFVVGERAEVVMECVEVIVLDPNTIAVRPAVVPTAAKAHVDLLAVVAAAVEDEPLLVVVAFGILDQADGMGISKADVADLVGVGAAGVEEVVVVLRDGVLKVRASAFADVDSKNFAVGVVTLAAKSDLGIHGPVAALDEDFRRPGDEGHLLERVLVIGKGSFGVPVVHANQLTV